MRPPRATPTGRSTPRFSMLRKRKRFGDAVPARGRASPRPEISASGNWNDLTLPSVHVAPFALVTHGNRRFSRYHAEAGIAAEHCLAPSFRQTRWDKVVECYALLEALALSPLHRLNRAVAVAELQGAAAGLAVLTSFEPPPWLTGSYLWAAVLADLHRRCGNSQDADRFQSAALAAAPTPAVKELLQRRLAGIVRGL